MNLTKTLSTAGIGAAIVVGSMLAVNLANAHGGGATEEGRAERVTEFAERFDLEESEVQSYFDEKKAMRQAEREENRAEFIAELVSDGTLTQEQADELATLKDEIKAELEALKESGADHGEIKSLMEENRAAIEAWADSEGIDLESIRPEHASGEGRKDHRMGHGPPAYMRGMDTSEL